jgi:phosphoribosylformylglycinamidine (FGAM) synthase PurS component
MRVQTRTIGNDGKTVTAQGICHDLETNLAVSVEVKRRITDKQGRTYSEDMQVMTGNAASAIAFRNSVLKVVPKAVTKKVLAEVKQVALGQAIDLETGRKNALANYAKSGVTEQMIFDYLSITKREEIDKERLFALKATWNAIKEGTTTVEEEFINPMKEREAAKKAEANNDKVSEAMAAATSGKTTTAATTSQQSNQKSLL